MSVVSAAQVLAAATPTILATGDQSGVEVAIQTALTDLLLGGPTPTFPVPATTVFQTVLRAGDVLYGVSATGGTVNVMRTRS